MSTIRDDLERRLALIEEPASRHVFTKLYPEAARAAADAADARRKAGLSLGALDGTIVSIKDLFDVQGEATTAGSSLRRKAQAALQDAPVVARLRRAGAVIVGKTNMSEFAFSGLGLNPHWGHPGNAADPSLVPGGSSSGPASRRPSAPPTSPSAPIPAARCASRLRSTAWSGSSRRPAGCRSPAPSRSRPRSIRSARSPARSRPARRRTP